jgi:hypothetical protein
MLELINLDEVFITLHGSYGGYTINTEIDVGEDDPIVVSFDVPNPRKDFEDNLEHQDWHVNKIHILN